MCVLAVMCYLLGPAQNWLCIPNDFCTAKHLYCRPAGTHTGISKGCCSVVGKKSVRVKSIPLYSSKVLAACLRRAAMTNLSGTKIKHEL